jgi:hypothetical protein
VRIGKIHVVIYKLSQQRRILSLSRIFSWLSQNRRMSKDYERLPESSEALVYPKLRLDFTDHLLQRCRVADVAPGHHGPSPILEMRAVCSSGAALSFA